MPISKCSPWVAFVLVLCAGQVLSAQSVSSTASKKGQPTQVVILSAVADRAHETLTIRGLNFGSQAPQVLCETNDMTVLSATPTEIVAQLPAAVPDGTYLLTVLRGPSTNDRDVFHVSVQTAQVATGADGRQGLPGPAGPRGEPGATGPAGPIGPVGPAGPQGPKGDAGPRGEVGPQGLTGAQGPAGTQGVAGPQGETGPQGAAGPQGATGPQGEAGLQGAMGPQGERGPEGAPGAAGPQGVPGTQGPAGPQGPAGVPGAVGPQGPAGPAGPQGTPGVSGYEVILTTSASVTVAGFGTFASTATCPVGKHAIAGGYEALGNGIQLTPVASHPASVDTWRVMLRSPSVSQISSVQLRVYVICAF